MKPDEKAKQLVAMFNDYVNPYIGSGMLSNSCDDRAILFQSKKCALIVVSEIIKTDMLIDEEAYVDTVSYLGFWEAVKKEIELL